MTLPAYCYRPGVSRFTGVNMENGFSPHILPLNHCIFNIRSVKIPVLQQVSGQITIGAACRRIFQIIFHQAAGSQDIVSHISEEQMTALAARVPVYVLFKILPFPSLSGKCFPVLQGIYDLRQYGADPLNGILVRNLSGRNTEYIRNLLLS